MAGLRLPPGSELGHFIQANGNTVKTLDLEMSYFDEYEQSIEEFARAVTSLNDEDGIILDESTTNFLYLTQVHNVYSFFDTMAYKLRSELGCPLIRRFWDKRNDPEAFRKRNCNATHSDFRWSETGPTKEQKFEDKGSIILAKRDRKILVPSIGRMPPEEVSFHELSKNILSANPDGVDDFTMDDLLKGINKSIWYDDLHFVKQKRNKERIEIKTAADALRVLVPHLDLDKVIEGRVEGRKGQVSKSRPSKSSIPPYISKGPSGSNASAEKMAASWESAKNSVLKSDSDSVKDVSKRRGQKKDRR